MLRTLSIRNFALLAEVHINFGAGLNILTGETGAGKSILIDALGAILGQRLSAGSIRTGAEWLRLEATFDIGEEAVCLRDFLSSQAIDVSGDELIIVRQITKAGRGQVLVNGCHVTLGTLKEIGALLVDIHGQNENLALMKETYQYALLDGYRSEIGERLADYRALYQGWQKVGQELDSLRQNSREYAQRLDMLKWQAQEIDDAHLLEGEDEKLTEDIRRLSHAEKISQSAEEAYACLESGVKGGASILASLSEVRKCLHEIARFDDALANAAKMVEEATIGLQEAAYEIRDYGEAMDFSPQKLDEMQRRMDAIDKLCRKYGANVAEVLEYRRKITDELARIENYDEDIDRLEKELAAKLAALRESGAKLADERRSGAAELSKILADELKDLGMPKAKLNFIVTDAEKFKPNGADSLEVMFSANVGEKAKPLAQVASGGEISRLALAVKAVTVSRQNHGQIMVFDEIDTGLGGRTAQMVAERIAKISAFNQVLCITHLPQIAAMADVHLYIAKESRGNSTETKVRELTKDGRVAEIARMASGVDATAASRENAREMLLTAEQKKSKVFRGK